MLTSVESASLFVSKVWFVAAPTVAKPNLCRIMQKALIWQHPVEGNSILLSHHFGFEALELSTIGGGLKFIFVS